MKILVLGYDGIIVVGAEFSYEMLNMAGSIIFILCVVTIKITLAISFNCIPVPSFISNGTL